MIEVEKKFLLNTNQISKLVELGHFSREVTFTDTYFDTKKYDFTLQDKWLRLRNDKYQLKVPLSLNNNRLVDQYREITSEQEIISYLNLNPDLSLSENITNQKLLAFCKCTTIRKKYTYQDFIIDIDKVEYKDYQYSICEIELIVKEESEVNKAITKILEFSKLHKLEVAPVRGKVIEYIRLKYPDLYKKLLINNQ